MFFPWEVFLMLPPTSFERVTLNILIPFYLSFHLSLLPTCRLDLTLCIPARSPSFYCFILGS